MTGTSPTEAWAAIHVLIADIGDAIDPDADGHPEQLHNPGAGAALVDAADALREVANRLALYDGEESS